jgi:hypothetical protein
MKYWFYLFMLVLASSVMTESTRAQNAVLQWDPCQSTNAVGYNVYYGTASGDYTCEVDAGDATSITLSNLTCGATYYFAATTYDDLGDESPLSAEVCFIVPGAFSISGPDPATGLPALNFPVVPGHWYEVQATTDLQNWTSIWESDVMTNNVWTVYEDPDAGAYSQRFYRLVTH